MEDELKQLRQRVAELEAQLDQQQEANNVPLKKVDQLNNEEIRRFGRQLILPEFGPEAQLKLRNSSILVVGAGGLGAPAILYLGSGGVGRLGIVDHDEVDISNLHRQVIHREKTKGMNKAVSAMLAVHEIHPQCQVTPYPILLDSTNALSIIKQYDIVLDATDNVATRYLLNDACVLAGKPLVSGSALRMDGQLTVYNHNGGPCYRCIHPVPPPPETVTNCSDGGVLGVIPGVIGVLQALEAIKIASGLTENQTSHGFLIFNGCYSPMFRSIKLRGKKKECLVCGENPKITELIDYVEFCGAGATDKEASLFVLKPEERIRVQEYKNVLENEENHLLLDVRSPVQYRICSLPNSISIPLDKLESQLPGLKEKIEKQNAENVYVVCRLGNDSQLAVQMLQKNGIMNVRDIAGGLYKWATDIDTSFPIY
ncbi:adenylyltransferase [Phascolomyces articulosus]|uniref:Needs CLA4 to survive protein 3 n=1 Tax=Phascolomyces articulosus TaxID=60185 RepID=A0AAD5KBF0_9FUNG|nr:adenylyltransferase [Phascolomyces articulosus]